MKLTVKLQVIIFLAVVPASFGGEIVYDDDVPEDRYSWEGYSIGPDLLGAFAMHMTADSYPAELSSVKFGFTRLSFSPQTSTWNFCILGHDAGSGIPDDGDVIYTSGDIEISDMDIPVWPSFSWYEHQVTYDGRLELDGDWWVVCHGHWYGDYAGWYITVDESDGGVGRDRTKTTSGWVPTSYLTGWDGGDLLIRSVVDVVAVDAVSLGRIKALFE